MYKTIDIFRTAKKAFDNKTLSFTGRYIELDGHRCAIGAGLSDFDLMKIKSARFNAASILMVSKIIEFDGLKSLLDLQRLNDSCIDESNIIKLGDFINNFLETYETQNTRVL